MPWVVGAYGNDEIKSVRNEYQCKVSFTYPLMGKSWIYVGLLNQTGKIASWFIWRMYKVISCRFRVRPLKPCWACSEKVTECPGLPTAQISCMRLCSSVGTMIRLKDQLLKILSSIWIPQSQYNPSRRRVRQYKVSIILRTLCLLSATAPTNRWVTILSRMVAQRDNLS